MQFVRRETKNLVLKSGRKARLSTHDLGFRETDVKQVFVNEQLTPAGNVLFAKANSRRKEKNWKSIWTADCKIFLQKRDNDRPLIIQSLADLEKID